jgi:protein subunit release factor B
VPFRDTSWDDCSIRLNGLAVAPYLSAVNEMTASPEQEDPIAQRMAALGVRETEIEESFVRSGGHGGQNVNKTSTCVMLLHRPTGIQVKCQTTRHQAQNRLLARALLLDKIEAQRKSRAAAERDRVEKIKRQKRGRSRGAKQRILADKSHHAVKKKFRRPVAPE